MFYTLSSAGKRSESGSTSLHEISIYLSVYLHVYLSVYLHVYLYKHIHTYIYIHIYIYILYMHIHTYMHTYIGSATRTHTHIVHAHTFTCIHTSCQPGMVSRPQPLAAGLPPGTNNKMFYTLSSAGKRSESGSTSLH